MVYKVKLKNFNHLKSHRFSEPKPAGKKRLSGGADEAQGEPIDDKPDDGDDDNQDTANAERVSATCSRSAVNKEREPLKTTGLVTFYYTVIFNQVNK